MSKNRPQFNHSCRRDGKVVIIALRGRLNGAAAMELKPEIDDLLNDGVRRVVLDFQELSYTGMHSHRIVLNVAKVLQRRNGRFALCPSDPALKEISRLASMMSLKIPTFDSLDEALAAVLK